MARIRKLKTNESDAIQENIWNIALYIRLSKDDGNDESFSVVNQRKILREYVGEGFQGEYVIVDEYIDDGKTGTDYDRPNFQRMIYDIKIKKVNCIICKNLARAFRNYSDQGYFIESFFPLHKTRFITLGDPKIDTYLNPETISGLEVPISGLMNDRFAAHTSNSVRRTFDNKRRNGKFIGAFAPYGYEKDPTDKNALIIDNEVAQVVKDIFHWYVYGDGSSNQTLSKEGIARKLNKMGIPNPTLYKIKKGFKYKNPHAKKNDGLWTGTSISRLLKNKLYIGTMVQGRQRVISYKVHTAIRTPETEWYQVKHTHEPIVDSEVFMKAQELQKKDTRTATNKRETYLFSGFLKCADCGKSMTRRNANGYIYYNCSTYKRKSKDKCTKHTIRLDKLKNAVLLFIQKHIELVETLDKIIININMAPVIRTKSTSLRQFLKLRQQEFEKTNELISGLYVDWKNGDLTRGQYVMMKEKFEKQEIEIKKNIENMQAEIDKMEQNVYGIDPYLQTFLKYKNIYELSQGLLGELISMIYIHEGGAITIKFKGEDLYKRIVNSIENKDIH